MASKKMEADSGKKIKAWEVLEDALQEGYSLDYLKKEWVAQIAEQTKPLTKQSKDLANKVIEEVMVLTRTLGVYKKEEADLEDMLQSGDYENNMTAAIAEELLEELRNKIAKTRKAIGQKKEGLSVDGRLSLAKLLGNEFLQVCMNALALKQRIRDKLRARKFEIEALERSYRSSVNQAKLEKHAQQQIKKKEPGIQSLVRNYNKLCEELSKLFAQRKAPKGATVPKPIETNGLFKLDVDDDIWQDVGLTNSNDDNTIIPDWLGNDTVRSGIKALLNYERCLEEEKRLVDERISLQQWFREEWAVVTKAIEWSTADKDVKFQLLERKEYLLRLYLAWATKVEDIPKKQTFQYESWGPSEEDILQAEMYEKTESTIDHNDKADEDDENMNVEDEGMSDGGEEEQEEWEDLDIDENDAELIDNMEMDVEMYDE